MIEPQPGMAPREMIRCDPDEVDRLATRLTRFAGNAADAAGRLSALDSEHWSGPAAERFRAALSDLPDQMHRGATAFQAAARELAGYAQALREGLRTAERAIGLAERAASATAAWRTSGAPGPDPGEPLRQEAHRLAELVAGDVRRAAVAAAQRLGAAADRAPSGGACLLPGTLPGIRADGTEIGAVVDHQLADRNRYLAPLDQLTADLRFGAEHEVHFAGGGTDWSSWSAAGEGRSIGTVSTDLVAGTALLGRSRRRTALESAGLAASDLRRRPRLPHGTEGAVGRTSGGGWRTGRTGHQRSGGPRPGGTIRAWSGPEGNPLRRPAASSPVTLGGAGPPAPAAVRHTGPPAAQDRSGRPTPASDPDPG
jgi:hypothetical protein